MKVMRRKILFGLTLSVALSSAWAEIPSGISVMAGSIVSPGNIDGDRVHARLNDPSSIALDSHGNIFVTETSSFTIRRIDSSGNVKTIAGKAGEPGDADGNGVVARFDSPDGVVIDDAGNLYVGDRGFTCVRKISVDGIVSTLDARKPIAGVSGDVPAIEYLKKHKYGHYGQPIQDAAGNSYEMPMFSGAIYRTTPDGKRTILAGRDKEFGAVDGVGDAARFSQILSMQPGKDGTLYVADTMNSLVRKITADGRVTTIAGAIEGPGTTASLEALVRPEGIAVDQSGNAYVLSYSGGKKFGNAVRKITPDGKVTTSLKFAELKSEMVKYGFEGRPRVEDRNIAADGQGNIYVSYNLGAIITKTTPDGKTSTLAGSDGVQGYADGAGAAARFSRPLGIATDSVGNIFVVDAGNCLLRKITPSGRVTTVAGKVGNCVSKDGVGDMARLHAPANLTVDGDDTLYFSEQDVKPENNGVPTIALRKMTKDGAVTTITDSLNSKQVGIYPFGAEGERPVSAIAADGKGNIYIGDSVNATVRKLSSSGELSVVAGQPGILGVAPGPLPGSFYGVNGLAIDQAGILYVTSANAVLKIQPANH